MTQVSQHIHCIIHRVMLQATGAGLRAGSSHITVTRPTVTGDYTDWQNPRGIPPYRADVQRAAQRAAQVATAAAASSAALAGLTTEQQVHMLGHTGSSIAEIRSCPTCTLCEGLQGTVYRCTHCLLKTSICSSCCQSLSVQGVSSAYASSVFTAAPADQVSESSTQSG